MPIVLGLLGLTIAGVRLRTFHEPLERDLVTYLLIGHAMNQGGRLYVDAWDIKPPGVYELYAWTEAAVGFGELQLYVLGVLTALVSLIGAYVAGSKLGRSAGLWSALFWTLLCSASGLQANQPNGEVFINACVIWALALLLHADRPSGGIARAFGILVEGELPGMHALWGGLEIVGGFVAMTASVPFVSTLQVKPTFNGGNEMELKAPPNPPASNNVKTSPGASTPARLVTMRLPP